MKRATDKQIAEAIERNRGNMSAAARALGIHRNTVANRAKSSDLIRETIDASRETFLDTAEDKLAEAVERGEEWAVKFALQTQGRRRGYGRHETREESGTKRVEIVRVDK